MQLSDFSGVKPNGVLCPIGIINNLKMLREDKKAEELVKAGAIWELFRFRTFNKRENDRDIEGVGEGAMERPGKDRRRTPSI